MVGMDHFFVDAVFKNQRTQSLFASVAQLGSLTERSAFEKGFGTKSFTHLMDIAWYVSRSLKVTLREKHPQLLYQAIAALNESVQVKPTSVEAWYNRGNMHFRLAQFQPVTMQRRYFEEAIFCCQRASEIDRAVSVIWYNWGKTCAALATIAGGEEKNFLAQAYAKYQRAGRQDPHNRYIRKLQGLTLLELATWVPEDRAIRIELKAFNLLEKSLVS